MGDLKRSDAHCSAVVVRRGMKRSSSMSGFSDVKSILSDIKLNLQSAECRHQNLVKQWCSPAEKGASQAASTIDTSSSSGVRALWQFNELQALLHDTSSGERKTEGCQRLPTLPSPLTQRPSVNRQTTPSAAKPKLHLENRQMQDILQTMPHNDLMEMKVSLEEEILQIETELGYTLKSEFTLIQSPVQR